MATDKQPVKFHYSALILLLLVLSASAQSLGQAKYGGIAKYLQYASAPASVQTNYNDLIFNSLGSSTSASSAASYTVSGVQPTANALVLVAVSNTKATAADAPTSVTGNGLTYAQLTNVTMGTSATNQMTLWIAQGAAPTVGTLTVNFGATETSCNIRVVEIQGADTSVSGGKGAIVASYTNGTTAASANPTINYSAPSAIGTNAVVWFVMDNVNSTSDQTPNTNWFKYDKVAHGTRLQGLGTHAQMNALNSSSATITATSRAWGGILVEVKPALIADPTTQPTLVQDIHYCFEQATIQSTGQPAITNLWANLPNPTLAGNCLVAFVVHGDSTVLTITDDKGNNWTPATNYDYTAYNTLRFSAYFATNIAAGTLQMKYNFVTTNTEWFHAEVMEFAHVALFNPLDQVAAVWTTGPGLIFGGPFTNAADGELVIHHAVDSHGGMHNSQTTGFRSYGGRFLTTDAYLSSFSSYVVQPKAGTINPFCDAATSSAVEVGGVCLSVKRGSGGTLYDTNAIRILREFQTLTVGASINETAYLPFDGNLAVMFETGPSNNWYVINQADNLANTWNRLAITNVGGNQIFVASNFVTRLNPPVVFSYTHKTAFSPPMVFYDIINAGTFPLATNMELDPATNALSNGSFVGMVVFDPKQANDLCIDQMAFGTGPSISAIGANYIYDYPYFYGQLDNSTLSSGDFICHYYNPDTTTVTFGCNMTNNTVSSANASGAEFKHK